MEIKLLAVHPVLCASDPTASARFFAQLGFSVVFQDRDAEPRYIGIARDGVELHLQWSVAPAQWTGDRPVYRFLVSDVDALYRAVASSGVFTQENNGRSPWAQPANTPWGTREFHLRDPDGNGLQFYQANADTG